MASGRKHKAGTAKMQPLDGKPKQKGKKKKREEEHEGAECKGSWRHLPPDLAAKILRLLPLHYAINATAVCKQWRAFLVQHSMSQDVKGDMLSPLFVSTSWCGYHAASSRWVRYPNLAFLPFSITRVHSSHRGLLLVESDSPSATALYLCNFATQRHWPLPPVPDDALPEHRNVGMGTMYWCHCHLRVSADGHTFSVTGLMRANCASGWPQLVRFDSNEGNWEALQVGLSCAGCGLMPKVFFEGVDRMVVLSNGCIYVMVPGKEGWCYLVKHDPVRSGAWELVSKVHVASAQIVAFGESLMAVALDHRWRRQMHLYRLVTDGAGRVGGKGEEEVEERLVLEDSSGPELAEFVEECGSQFWYTTSCASSCRIYVGVRLCMKNNEREADIVPVGHHQQRQLSLVEYEGASKAWRHVPLPDFVAHEHLNQHTSIDTADAYHELGLATHPTTA